jgi:hypothetical protein
VGPLLARRAEQERRVRGGFRSLEEFGEALGLKPHALERLRALTTIGPPPPPDAPDAPPSAGGRVVDF